MENIENRTASSASDKTLGASSVEAMSPAASSGEVRLALAHPVQMTLEEMLASFDKTKHGGEVMDFPPVGREKLEEWGTLTLDPDRLAVVASPASSVPRDPLERDLSAYSTASGGGAGLRAVFVAGRWEPTGEK
jgi:hypothetical protein